MQLISASTSGPGAAEAVMQPMRPASLSGHAATRAAGKPAADAADFRARLLSVASDPDAAAQPQVPPAGPVPAELPQGMDEAARETAGEDVSEQGAAEQWLLGMLDQQRVQVQARDSVEFAQVSWSSPAAPVDADGLVDEFAEAVLSGRPLPLSAQPQTERLLANAALARPVVETGVALNLLALGAGATEFAAELPVEALTLRAAAEDVREAAPLLGESPASSVAPGAERLLKLQAPEAKWGEQMLHALREHVEVQLQQRQQSASIRLDPPELGSLEIHLSHESGRLTVQLSAAHADVARLLQQTSDRLRQELVGQHFVQVNVQVAADGQSGQQGQARQRMPAGEEPVAANGLAEDTAQDTERSGSRARDVLVTV